MPGPYTWDPYFYDQKPKVNFNQLNPMQQIQFTRTEFMHIAKALFESPEMMKQWLLDKWITNEQAKAVLTGLDRLSRKNCYCCKRFDQMLVAMTPIDQDLQPLLEIAKRTVKAKLY